MSSIANTPWNQDSKPAAFAARLWPWTVGVRVLFIVVTMLGAIGLRMASLRLNCEARGPFRAVPVLVVDPNSAPPEVLGALPHVGGALVKKIVEQREIRPFQSLADLRHRVRGLGPATLARLAPHLRIEQPNPTQDDRHRLIAAIPNPQKLAQGPGDSDVR
jgi:competence protein ComEA